ncbi:TrbG/VirB9 family P-type conjugative transfer protein [Shinella kummerowiae]|jgi:type IV secretion system protein VirB9|uniref:Conjugal transfer protein n=1 Tax=Shinella kummerowiae TaxID=417745 RepID=A0A6N8SP36_9HYPH|nr:TrbG/VirB9 family P-type conjugative transfer protein [Shinella kummerowiae]MCT7667479.1 TrbG/VirB9 family P-type conjugative transfer protein [Shinella kummerowiae]MXN48976.1 conjugal transfer protein [Shinella kummerowiae]
MMNRFFLPLFFLFSLSHPVFAEQAPVGFKSDIRIKRYVYDENNVYKLNLYLKSVTALQFADGENVESILIGDSASWEVVKLKMGNVISLKPIIDEALTNMTIYTDRRVYTFELISAGEIKAGMKAGADQAFRTVFTYPEEFTAVDKSLVKGGPINQNYMVSGQTPFRPIAVHDNTLQTTFILPKGAQRPAVFKVGHDRQEKLVNSRTDGDRIIVDGTSDFWVMRIGDEMVCIGRAGAIQMAQATRKDVGHVK